MNVDDGCIRINVIMIYHDNEISMFINHPSFRIWEGHAVSPHLDEDWPISIKLIRSHVVPADTEAFCDALVVQKVKAKNVLRFLRQLTQKRGALDREHWEKS